MFSHFTFHLKFYIILLKKKILPLPSLKKPHHFYPVLFPASLSLGDCVYELPVISSPSKLIVNADTSYLRQMNQMKAFPWESIADVYLWLDNCILKRRRESQEGWGCCLMHLHLLKVRSAAAGMWPRNWQWIMERNKSKVGGGGTQGSALENTSANKTTLN